MMWEYVIEAVAERPSMQDIMITPVTGSIVGEMTHRVTMKVKANGTTFPEKLLLLVINPMNILFSGFN